MYTKTSEQRRDWACWALQHVELLPGLSAPQWELVISQARRADVLARLAARLQTSGQLDSVLAAPRSHLRAAMTLWRAQQDDVRAEAAQIAAVLRDSGCRVVLLKGAAYVAGDLPAAQGRLFSDIDILVPRAALRQVESNLMLAGWMGTHLDDYDQRYYREWMHELPPMQHLRRGTTLDVHHNILPITVRQPPDAALLIANAHRLPAYGDGLWTLAPCDMLLHSMTHLFHNDDLSHALRDVSDMDLLLRHFSTDPNFWPELMQRARLLHLQRPLAFGVWAASEFLGTPVPDEVRLAVDRAEVGWSAAIMRWLWRRVLRTPHVDAALPGASVAQFVLYLRAHWLRMPPMLLIRHLTIKAWKRIFAKSESPSTGQPA